MFAPSATLGDVVIVTLDEKSYRDLNQQYDKLWDRRLYARFVDRLTTDQAKLVVFDVFFSDPGEAAENEELAQAMRRNGHVVLAMDFRKYAGLTGGEPIYPRDEFKEAAAGIGLAQVSVDEADGVVRELPMGEEDYPSLAWRAAGLGGAPASLLQTRLQATRWLCYPSSLEQLHRISFSDALIQKPRYFSNRVVFVGGAPRIKKEGDQADQFATPFHRWRGAAQPGVIIQAIAYLNLVQGDFLQKISPVTEILLVLALGAAFAAGLSQVRPWLGAITAAALVVILYASACVIVYGVHRWFNWVIIAGVEVPCALTWSIFVQTRSLKGGPEPAVSQGASPRRWVKRLLPGAGSAAVAAPADKTGGETEPSVAVAPGGTVILPPEAFAGGASAGGQPEWVPPSVPDHKLVRCIGEGAYGQVWLARDVIGSYHAVKFVYRKTFKSADPFDREFRGIHFFTPISRMHPGFVNILHVGRNEGSGYFFYIMELCDDETTGQNINPENYTARTLGRLIWKQGRLAALECLRVGLELSSALDFLHGQRLIHRDIKPSNVLFVHNHAKFADVGLVTQIESHRRNATYIGTEGYIAPEGPGTAAADIYSLGKVLYEACMGLDRLRFPDLPTTVVEASEPLVIRLNQVILKACEFNPRDRYKSAQELHDDLKALTPK